MFYYVFQAFECDYNFYSVQSAGRRQTIQSSGDKLCNTAICADLELRSQDESKQLCLQTTIRSLMKRRTTTTLERSLSCRLTVASSRSEIREFAQPPGPFQLLVRTASQLLIAERFAGLLVCICQKGVVSDRAFKRGKPLQHYSVEMLISCAEAVQNGCMPTSVDYAWKFLEYPNEYNSDRKLAGFESIFSLISAPLATNSPQWSMFYL